MAEATKRKAGHPSTAGRGRRRTEQVSATGVVPPPPPPRENPADSTHAPLCSVGFCPVCLAVTALGDVRPELTEHMLLAGREVLLALRSLIDSRLESTKPATKLQRITID